MPPCDHRPSAVASTSHATGFGKGKRRLGRGAQMSFADRKLRRKDGALRAKPGRKPTKHANVRHRARPEHDERHPMHVTMRAAAGVPSFRSQVVWAAFEKAFRTTRRADFRIVEFSVQTNHVHLVVEAADAKATASGIKSFAVRANRLVNSALKRAGLRATNRGRVWGDRYHRRDLTTPRAVRNALVYCINNYRKHGGPRDGGMRLDPCSSGRWFEGWVAIRKKDDGPRPTEPPRQPLLLYLWKRAGLLHPGEAPRLPA